MNESANPSVSGPYILYQNVLGSPMRDFILEMAQWYEEKKGARPQECLVNPMHELEGEIEGIKIVSDKATLPKEIMLR